MEQKVVCIKNIPDFGSIAKVNLGKEFLAGYSSEAVELSVRNELNLIRSNANFKINKIYIAKYTKNIIYIRDDFGLDWVFDIKWQTPLQDFFNFKLKNMLFKEHFITLEEMRKNKLNKINNG